MSNFWMTQETLRLVGWAYIPACVGALLFALWIPKRWWMKTIAAGCVLGLASILPLKAKRQYDEAQAKAAEFAQRQAKARALFEERCKTAGERVYKTVEGVDGVTLLTLLDKTSGEYQDDRNPARLLSQEDLIRSFLLRIDGQGQSSRLIYSAQNQGRPGYRFVEVTSPTDKQRVRFSLDDHLNLQSSHPTTAPPRVAITIQIPVNRSDREQWIATTLITIVEVETGQEIARSEMHVFDSALGSRVGQRTPWLFAEGCGIKHRYQPHSARILADLALKPN